MNFFAEYGMFLIKCATLVVGILITFGGIVALSRKDSTDSSGKLKVKHLNKSMKEKEYDLNEALLSKKAFKHYKKAEDKKEKKLSKNENKPRLFVLDFNGDVKGSQVEHLRELINYILAVAKPTDETLVRLESPGGMVSAYGLAANQLDRLRQANVDLTVAVDKVAASGGYLMACVAKNILAAPFSIVGSIGVIAGMPNFHRLLKKNDVDYEQITAGEFKRTLTLLGENTKEGRLKKQEQVDEIHKLFKDFVAKNRPIVDIDQVATGEYWLASDTMDMNLVDKIQTSDDYLWQEKDSKDIYHLSIEKKRSVIEKLLNKAEDACLKMGIISYNEL